jgi:hypothetical protein
MTAQRFDKLVGRPFGDPTDDHPFIVEVIASAGGEWTPNALSFETEADAEAYALDLSRRWTAVRETRVVDTRVTG